MSLFVFPLDFFLVEGDLLGQDTDLAVQLAEADGHEELLGQQQKDDDHIHKVDGAHEAQQVGGPVGDAGEDGQNQQSGAEQQPEDRILDLDFCLAHAAQDVPRCDQAAEDQADADKRLVEHFTGSFRDTGSRCRACGTTGSARWRWTF